jgi:hypothetical protein
MALAFHVHFEKIKYIQKLHCRVYVKAGRGRGRGVGGQRWFFDGQVCGMWGERTYLVINTDSKI